MFTARGHLEGHRLSSWIATALTSYLTCHVNQHQEMAGTPSYGLVPSLSSMRYSVVLLTELPYLLFMLPFTSLFSFLVDL